MADVAISALPAQTPVASTAVLPLVEGGATKKATALDVVKGGGALLKDGTVAATANLPMGGNRITGGADGIAPTDFTVKSQVEALIAGALSSVADWKNSVRAATTANITLSGTQTVDGVALANGDRVLVKNQTTGSQNGIYNVGTPWVRATDCDVSAEVTAGLAVAVEEGTANGPAGGRNLFLLTTPNPIVLGTTALTFTGIGTLVADGTTLQLVGNTLSVATGGVGTAQLAADAVTWAKVQNVSAASRVIGRGSAAGAGDAEELTPTGGIEVSGTNLQRSALSGDITAAAGSGTTAIAANVIVDADVNTAAAIAGTKISPNFGNQNVVTTGTLGSGKATIAPAVETTGSPRALHLTAAAHTTLTASAEVIDVDIALNRTVQRATGAVTTQRAMLVRAPTYSFVAASVIAAAAAFAIDGPPVAGTNATITESYALWVQSGAVRLGGLGAGFVKSSATGVLSVAAIAAGDIADGSITYAKIQDVSAASRLLGRGSAAGPGDVQELTVGGGIEFSGTAIQRSALTGDVTAAAGSNTTAIAANVIVDADINASAAIAGTKISPNFGAQNITTTGDLLLGTTPASVGDVRVNHGFILNGRDNGNANDRSGVRFGAASNDTWTFGDAAVATQLVGSSVLIGDSTELIEVASLATNREIISLLLGATLTTTHMTANTGDKVVFWANATTMPTTGFPVGGGILGVDSALGLEWKGANGVETTIAPHGDSGNTTKRRMIGWMSRPLRTQIAPSGVGTIASFDAAALNGVAVTSGAFKVVGHYIAKGSGYAQAGQLLAYMDVVAGVVSVGSTQDHVAGAISNGGPFSGLVIDNSGTTVRLQATCSSVSGVTEVYGYFEVMEFEP